MERMVFFTNVCDLVLFQRLFSPLFWTNNVVRQFKHKDLCQTTKKSSKCRYYGNECHINKEKKFNVEEGILITPLKVPQKAMIYIIQKLLSNLLNPRNKRIAAVYEKQIKKKKYQKPQSVQTQWKGKRVRIKQAVGLVTQFCKRLPHHGSLKEWSPISSPVSHWDQYYASSTTQIKGLSNPTLTSSSTGNFTTSLGSSLVIELEFP